MTLSTWRLALICVVTLAAVNARAGIVVFDNLDEFRAAAGPLVEIDFSVLPDGTPTPSSGQFPLTPDFNYTDWGVTFSSPNPDLHINASPCGASLLAVSKSSVRNWIIADFQLLAYAVGVTTRSELFIYGADGNLLARAPSAGFVGLLSDFPISHAVIDRESNGATIGSIHFSTVPEPATLGLLAAGLLPIARRTRLRGKWRGC